MQFTLNFDMFKELEKTCSDILSGRSAEYPFSRNEDEEDVSKSERIDPEHPSSLIPLISERPNGFCADIYAQEGLMGRCTAELGHRDSNSATVASTMSLGLLQRCNNRRRLLEGTRSICREVLPQSLFHNQFISHVKS